MTYRRDVATTEASTLSPRELETVHLTALGLSSRAIGSRLGISPRTVEVHRSRAMHKLGARNRAQLILSAVNHGIVTTDALLGV
jgi:two-component system, LuxR family, response regulator FixJ